MKNLKILMVALFMPLLFASCSDDEESTFVPQTMTFNYMAHNGQAVPDNAYNGVHNTEFTVAMQVMSLENGNAMITTTLNNTESGAIYHIHAHDGADPSSTPNGTPYVESPNSDIFAQSIEGNGGMVSISQEANLSYSDLVDSYSGFFVVHDPYQAINTADITTYLVVGSFAREQAAAQFRSQTFNYAFNTGQLVADFAYTGDHATNLTAEMEVTELSDNTSRVVFRINETMTDQVYHVHAHDMADPSTTPNGTPFIESPNSNVYAGQIVGNGGSAARSQISGLSYEELVETYQGFVVVHDPLQAVSTTDPTTYVVLGIFAQ